MSRLLTPAEIAERLRVSTGTVFSLARHEGLPLIRVSPRRYLVSEEGLATWLDGRVVSGDLADNLRVLRWNEAHDSSNLTTWTKDEAIEAGWYLLHRGDGHIGDWATCERRNCQQFRLARDRR